MARNALTTAAVACFLALPGGVGAQALPGHRDDHSAARAEYRAYALGEFQQVLDDWLDAVQDGDAARAARLYSDDAYLQLSHPIIGVDGIQVALDRWTDDVASIRSGLADFDASGSLAYGTVRVVLHGTTPRSDGQGMMLIVLRRYGGEWKIRAQTLILSDD